MKLFYHPGNASMAPHCVLEEIGCSFELAHVDRARNMHKSADYLKLNPNGLIPALVDGDLVLYETAAICLHLADTHPAHQLAPALGTPARAGFYKWLMWLTNTLQSTLIVYFYPDRWVDKDNISGTEQVKSHAESRVAGLLDQLDAQVASHGGPWFLGEQYTVLDPYVMMVCRWTRGHARPARDLPALGPYLQRVLARPAIVRALQAEGLEQPWV